MNIAYALDTNIIIKYLRGEPNVEQNFDTTVVQGNRLVIPKAVDYEMQRGFNITAAPKKEAAYDFLARHCTIVEIDIASWDRAIKIYGDLYRKGFTVGEMDILISAICLENDYTLVTNNTADFTNIDGIKLADWTKPSA
jgi:tRNA(fMet)-specific endonuclease VapC